MKDGDSPADYGRDDNTDAALGHAGKRDEWRRIPANAEKRFFNFHISKSDNDGKTSITITGPVEKPEGRT